MVSSAVSAGINALQAIKESKLLILLVMMAYMAPWGLLYYNAWLEPSMVQIMVRQFGGVDERIDKLIGEMDQLSFAVATFNESEECL